MRILKKYDWNKHCTKQSSPIVSLPGTDRKLTLQAIINTNSG